MAMHQPSATPQRRTRKRQALLGAGICAFLTITAAVALAALYSQESPALELCDAWLKETLAEMPRATNSVDNANAAVAHVQSQRAQECRPEAWNPQITEIEKRSDGSIAVGFAAATGNSNRAAVTLTGDGARRWLYHASA